MNGSQFELVNQILFWGEKAGYLYSQISKIWVQVGLSSVEIIWWLASIVIMENGGMLKKIYND